MSEESDIINSSLELSILHHDAVRKKNITFDELVE